eukprot:gnl/TRDRNA2_/TRDRNA2_33715_c0_seq1.p3 gnl/TRDRNA2_/TRDRNA2_33715_c0~~gnl/TRDRNA2_/TRDRNA2_33715_c0_seq1.p3  ORF type:complete len:116 (+),score=18.10 gnl/TRDRNA2_/TRDRNA2_33715_c0_seq1:604-951(+)
MRDAAYMKREQWVHVLKRTGFDECEMLLLDRYDAVIHLVTAADGAQAAYGTDTNEVRFETVDEAREMDVVTKDAWSSHPRLHVVDNSTDFEGKVRRVLDIVEAALARARTEKFPP